jgi:hypothetical protein
VALVLVTDEGLRQAVTPLGGSGALVEHENLALLASIYPPGGPWAAP